MYAIDPSDLTRRLVLTMRKLLDHSLQSSKCHTDSNTHDCTDFETNDE